MKSLFFFILSSITLAGCVTTDPALMTLGKDGQLKTSVAAWKDQIQVETITDATGNTRGSFSALSFQRALQQTLINVGYMAPSRQGPLHLHAQVSDALSAPFADKHMGLLRVRYSLIAGAGTRVLLNEKIDTMCYSSAKVQADDKSVMEECARQNIGSFLRKLEKRGLETTP